ncbi:hypothetical protein LOK49_LG14G02298 [Camellia lanceoleosa]|uniref:Uncharacterized protein n=1 Tax=Camellia lanceoleosa TaxID=1840588 RepID=A0ACC0FE15_9ERIC|nr:hypothetical protein LOK49_LG14G02298 [Camellia lanceoleosa]
MEKLKLRASAAAAGGGGGAISAEAMSICLFLLITIFLSAAFGIGSESEQQLLHNNKEGLSTKAYTSLSERVKDMFSLSSTTPPPTPRIWSSSWNKAQSLFNQLQAYFFPPNLDFRGRKEMESDGGAAGEKVKEAMAKSFGKSRATVEDSAKSAAKFAGETLHTTADKVKKSFSHPDHHHQTSSDDDQAEL